MISHSSTSFKKQFLYLTGLIVSCFFHFSCQFLPASLSMADGNKSDTSSTTNDNSSRPSIKHAVKIESIDVAFAGQSKTIKDCFGHLIAKSEGPQAHSVEGATVCSVRQDAFCIKEVGKRLIIAMLDGVGAYNSGPYTYAITKNIASSNADSTQGLMEDAYKKTGIKSQEEVKLLDSKLYEEYMELFEGQCTALVVDIKEVATNKFELTYANVGDCKLMVIRNNEIVFETKQQVDEVYKDPNVLSIPNPYREDWEPKHTNTPDQSDRGTFQLIKGDRVLISTDGLFHNISKEVIKKMVEKYLSAQELVDELVGTAYKTSEATGGHPDDITAVCLIMK